MNKDRVSVRMSGELMDALDTAAYEQGRTRSNYVNRVLGIAASVRTADVCCLTSDIIGYRTRLGAFRISPPALKRLDGFAKAQGQTRSKLIVRLLSGVILYGWDERAAMSVCLERGDGRRTQAGQSYSRELSRVIGDSL